MIIYFPLIAIGTSLLAYLFPTYLTGFKPYIIPLLTIIMFGMGVLLTIDDFKRILVKPKVIALGLLLQFLVMPLAAYLVSLSLGLPTALLIGMLLVGASSGGTASNVMCYLAKGNVALSITLTMSSTLLAIIAMPALTWLYIGHTVSVPVENMLESIVRIVMLPVLLGVAINSLLGKYLDRVRKIFPLISMAAIIIIIAIIVALNANKLSSIALPITYAVILHNMIGLVTGYLVAIGFGYNKQIARTLAIEVGMQNSGLSVALAIKYFSAFAAVPGALFSIWHNISGSLLAAFWSRKATN
jgi:BASS family bile acid:Na+ symporter